ncbi:MAG: FimV/HubP family polar landmark protein [Casimicrobiaceae bacterium]
MRATPKFTLSMVALALALPGSAYALGLGKLTVDSALGQPLSARVDLTSATREEVDTLTARVADPSLYRQNNLTYQAALARARVAVETGSDGVPYLRISSSVSVLEPYLDLIVEVSWASGRVVRDYTLLLDPPGVNTGGNVEPVTPMRQGTGAAAPASRGTPASRASTAPATSAAPRAPGEGYTVKRGDTLARIASENKPADVTLDQMLVALFKSNTDAFAGNNMNRLRAGAIMTIPDAATVTAEPATDAQKVVRVQASDWRAYRDHVAAAAPEAGAEGTRTAAGSIGTAVQEKTPAVAPGSDRLRVSREAQGKGRVAEDAVARDKQLAEAQSRIGQLEKMLADAQHAVDIKNQTLAQAQNRADAASGNAPSTPPSTPAPSAITQAPSTAPAITPVPTPVAPANTPPAAAIATPPAPSASTPPTTTPDTSATPATAPATDAAKAPEPAVAPVVVPKAAPKATPRPARPAPSFFDQLTDAIPLWALGVAIAAILGLIALLVSSRRRKTTKFEDSIISGTDIKTNTVFGSTGGGVVNTGDNSLASDFSREGLGNIDTDEVDPIAEAEVYLAYGRDAQAEEILKDALKKDPQRQEIYLKLLEIHAQHNKPSAFETVAAELYAQCHGQGEIWQKVVALGRQLDPNNPMFAEGSANVAPRAAVSAADVDAFTIGPDLTLPPKHGGGGIDMQLDDEITVSPTSGVAARPKTPADILAGADRAVERSSSETMGDRARATSASIAAAAGAAAGVAAARTMDAGKMDLDFHLDDSDKPAPIRAPAPAPVARTPLPVLETAGATAPSGTSDRLARPAAALELDKLDLSFDPDKATFEDPTPSVLDGQWHDAATKLDLAKAYQEMGDVEGAREILQEVLHEGDEQQRGEAQALLSKLG